MGCCASSTQALAPVSFSFAKDVGAFVTVHPVDPDTGKPAEGSPDGAWYCGLGKQSAFFLVPGKTNGLFKIYGSSCTTSNIKVYLRSHAVAVALPPGVQVQMGVDYAGLEQRVAIDVLDNRTKQSGKVLGGKLVASADIAEVAVGLACKAGGEQSYTIAGGNAKLELDVERPLGVLELTEQAKASINESDPYISGMVFGIRFKLEIAIKNGDQAGQHATEVGVSADIGLTSPEPVKLQVGGRRSSLQNRGPIVQSVTSTGRVRIDTSELAGKHISEVIDEVMAKARNAELRVGNWEAMSVMVANVRPSQSSTTQVVATPQRPAMCELMALDAAEILAHAGIYDPSVNCVLAAKFRKEGYTTGADLARLKYFELIADPFFMKPSEASALLKTLHNKVDGRPKEQEQLLDLLQSLGVEETALEKILNEEISFEQFAEQIRFQQKFKELIPKHLDRSKLEEYFKRYEPQPVAAKGLTDAGVMTPGQMAQTWVPILKSKGARYQQRSTKFARLGRKGERVVSVVHGDVKSETTIKDAKTWVLMSPHTMETYVCDDASFQESTRGDPGQEIIGNATLGQKGMKEYRWEKEVWAIQLNSVNIEQIPGGQFQQRTGEVVQVYIGNWIACILPKCEFLYQIPDADFQKTYTPEDAMCLEADFQKIYSPILNRVAA